REPEADPAPRAPNPPAGGDALSTGSQAGSEVRQGPLTDDELWAVAVDGADPLADRSARVKPGPEPIAMVPGPLDPELAAYDELRALVSGAAPFDIADTDEFIEGCARGLDHHLLRRLRRGEVAVPAHVDERLPALPRRARRSREVFRLKKQYFALFVIFAVQKKRRFSGRRRSWRIGRAGRRNSAGCPSR